MCGILCISKVTNLHIANADHETPKNTREVNISIELGVSDSSKRASHDIQYHENGQVDRGTSLRGS